MTEVAIGGATLRLALPDVTTGGRVRINILARDVILATIAPQGLSVRNAIAGTLVDLADEAADSVLASVAVADARIVARITRAAVRELALAPGMPVWALVKSASLRAHTFTRVAAPPPRR